VRPSALPLIPVKGGSVSTLEEQIHDERMDKNVLNNLPRDHGVAT